MGIVLSVIRCPEGATPGTWRSDDGDVLLGRDPSCDWVLPDPERHLSKRHCAVEFRGGAWQVRDLSTNGTFLNRAAEPVGRERSERLADGDRLHLGGYEIEIRIAGPVGRGAAAMDDPFAPAEPAHGWPPPARAPAPSPSPPLPDQDDPFRAPGPERAPTQWPSASPQPWAGSAASPFSLDPVPAPAASGLPHPLPGAADPFGALPPMPDHAPSGHDAFVPPRAAPGPGLLPEDWDLDPAELLPAAQPRPAPAPARPGQPPRAPEPAARPTAAATPHPESSAAGAEAALAAFLAAAGVPRGAVPPTPDPTAALAAMGAAFGAAVAALRALLVARGEVKREFRIEQTMLRAAGNNPLKFAPDDAAAVAQLLGLGEAAAAGAVRGVAADLEAHQIATLAATQAAARALLDRLSPAAVEAEAECSGAMGGLAVLPAQRRARLWEEYARLHRCLEAEFEDDFESAFGKAFARAYEGAAAAAKGRKG